MGQYLDKLRRFESARIGATQSTQARAVIEPDATNARPSPSSHNEDGIAPKGPSIMPLAVSHCSSEMTYCERCGGGYWIRVTYEAPLQCGRCMPSGTRVETLFFPGGSLPPSSQVSRTGSTEDIIIEPAATNARPVYWETGTGRILGPVTPELLAKDGETFWMVTTFEWQTRWINAGQLQSKQAFEQQIPVREVEPIRF